MTKQSVAICLKGTLLALLLFGSSLPVSPYAQAGDSTQIRATESHAEQLSDIFEKARSNSNEEQIIVSDQVHSLLKKCCRTEDEMLKILDDAGFGNPKDITKAYWPHTVYGVQEPYDKILFFKRKGRDWFRYSPLVFDAYKISLFYRDGALETVHAQVLAQYP